MLCISVLEPENEKESGETSRFIAKTQGIENRSILDYIFELGKKYYNFQYNAESSEKPKDKNSEPYRKIEQFISYYGLRDFYYFIKSICKLSKKFEDKSNEDKSNNASNIEKNEEFL